MWSMASQLKPVWPEAPLPVRGSEAPKRADDLPEVGELEAEQRVLERGAVQIEENATTSRWHGRAWSAWAPRTSPSAWSQGVGTPSPTDRRDRSRRAASRR